MYVIELSFLFPTVYNMPRVISFGLGGILARARVVVAAKRIFLIVLYKAKMAKNRPKIAIKCLKMV